MTHPLDRPIWKALSTKHAALAEGGELAKRYHPSISPFAAARDESRESIGALSDIARPGETLMFLQAAPVAIPEGFAASMTAMGVQMVAGRSFAPLDDVRIVSLGKADAADMLDLATLTKPGPFTARAIELGGFWGIREEGRLIAMAGERFGQEGFSEISGVCAHPDFRGRGLGRLLSLHVAGVVCARGEQPYLHAFATNEAAIRLYDSLGFRWRVDMHVAAIARQAAASGMAPQAKSGSV